MRRALVAFGVVALVTAGALTLSRATAEDGGPKFTVEVAGVRNVAPPYKGELSALGSWQGLTVALLVKAEGCQVTGMDSGSRVKEVGDDTGADLFVGQNDSGRQTGFGMNVQVAKDASAIMIEIDTPKMATKGAKAAHIEGKLVLHVANGTEPQKAELAFAEGAKVEVGPVPFEIEKVGESGWDEYPLQLTLKSKKSFESIAGMKFQDEGGNEIKSTLSGTWSTGSSDDPSFQYVINVGKKLAKGSVVLDCRKDLKNVTVPFKLDAPLGF